MMTLDSTNAMSTAQEYCPFGRPADHSPGCRLPAGSTTRAMCRSTSTSACRQPQLVPDPLAAPAARTSRRGCLRSRLRHSVVGANSSSGACQSPRWWLLAAGAPSWSVENDYSVRPQLGDPPWHRAWPMPVPRHADAGGIRRLRPARIPGRSRPFAGAFARFTAGLRPFRGEIRRPDGRARHRRCAPLVAFVSARETTRDANAAGHHDGSSAARRALGIDDRRGRPARRPGIGESGSRRLPDSRQGQGTGEASS